MCVFEKERKKEKEKEEERELSGILEEIIYIYIYARVIFGKETK